MQVDCLAVSKILPNEGQQEDRKRKTYPGGIISFKNRNVMMAKMRLTVSSTHTMITYAFMKLLVRVRLHIARVWSIALAVVKQKTPMKSPK